MYGQTGSGKTYTMMGPKWINYADMSKGDNVTPRQSEIPEKPQLSGKRLLDPNESQMNLSMRDRSKSPIHRKLFGEVDSIFTLYFSKF